MELFDNFLDPATVSLKICGVTTQQDAMRLAEMGVDALGVNFWSCSKRYLAPSDAQWLSDLAGGILRVGVFVNADPELPIQLWKDGLIDVVQLHGDELAGDAACYRDLQVPFIKAFGVKSVADLVHATSYGASAVLLDAHAPGIYGGTGEVFDWEVASDFRRQHPELPVILAGGIVPENAGLAAMSVLPAALDIASGAESSPGVKDFAKVAAFLTALNR
jgi:phosphoribosylanthranilate isomerase